MVAVHIDKACSHRGRYAHYQPRAITTYYKCCKRYHSYACERKGQLRLLTHSSTSQPSRSCCIVRCETAQSPT